MFRLCEVEVFGSSKYSCDVEKCVFVNDARSGTVMIVFFFLRISDIHKCAFAVSRATKFRNTLTANKGNSTLSLIV